MFRFLADSVDPFQPYDPVTPSERVWPFVRQHMGPLRGVIIASLFFTAIGALIEVWLIFYAGRIVDALAAAGPARVWEELGPELLAAAAVLLLLRPLNALINESLDDIAFRPNAVGLIRWRAHRHILQQSIGWFRNEQSGRLANRVREIGVAAAGIVYTLIHTLAYVLIYVAGAFWLMATIDLRLLIPLVIWAALYLALMGFAVPRFRDCTERWQASLTELTAGLADSYANIDTIKLFAGDDGGRSGLGLFQRARSTFTGVQLFEVIINVGMVALANLLLVGLVGYAIWLWQAGDAQLGLIAAALALSVRISAMAEWMLDGVSALFGSIGATREALKSIAQPLRGADRPDAGVLELRGGAIRFDHVSLKYGSAQGGVEDISLSVKPGEKVGLVGPSGAGKSTLVNLLLRFFEPESGAVLIDDQDIAGVTGESLRRHISMVGQDSALLHRSVRENIAIDQPGRSLEEIRTAAERAQADRFITSLADQDGRTGYDALVGERGVRLSGGQRQRIALARAILKDAPILILDEATSALDSDVEADVLDALYAHMAQKTVIAIAHRLSTIARLDRIVVLAEGRIAEQGTHEDLLTLNGVYARLWARQSGGFLGR